MLDAVGRTITEIKKRHKYASDDCTPGKTVAVIITDGYENASREFSLQQVKRLIEEQKEQAGWEFLFLGANMDAVEVAEGFGISHNMSATYMADSVGTRKNFAGVERVFSNVRSGRTIPKDWKKEIENYEKTAKTPKQ